MMPYPAMDAALRRGYAVAGTDTGHEGNGGPWMQHREKLIDFGHRAVHEMTVKAKAIVESFYGTAPRFAYFTGCSGGGRQALMEAQRYPDDFDGIVAGSPSLNATGRAAFSMSIAQNLRKEPASYIPAAKYPAIHKAVLDACDAKDGVADGVIENPARCTFDPKALRVQRRGLRFVPDRCASRRCAIDLPAAARCRNPGRDRAGPRMAASLAGRRSAASSRSGWPADVPKSSCSTIRTGISGRSTSTADMALVRQAEAGV